LLDSLLQEMGKRKKNVGETSKINIVVEETGKTKEAVENNNEIRSTAADKKGGKKWKRMKGKKKKFVNGDINKKETTKKVIVPKLKDLQKENISSNWKTLLKAIASEPQKSTSWGKHGRRPARTSGTTAETTTSEEVWFDDVDDLLLQKPEVEDTANALVKEHAFDGLTRIIGMDCEMVGIGRGGEDSILARVSIVNHFGHTVYDTFVKPTERVTDYRTHVSGVRPQDLVDVPEFSLVQTKVSEIIKERILVGHAIHHDMKVLFLDHPRKLIRDTSKYKPFRANFGGKTPGLKHLSDRYLGVKVQTGEHSSVQDAQAAVRLYTLVRNDWEKEIKEKHKLSKFRGKKKVSKELNNKSSLLSGLQAELSSTGTKQYVDSDEE